MSFSTTGLLAPGIKDGVLFNSVSLVPSSIYRSVYSGSSLNDCPAKLESLPLNLSIFWVKVNDPRCRVCSMLLILYQWCSNFIIHKSYLNGLIKYILLGASPRVWFSRSENNSSSQTVISKPIESASSGNLSEMEIHGQHLRPIESETVGWDPAICVLIGPSRSW